MTTPRTSGSVARSAALAALAFTAGCPGKNRPLAADQPRVTAVPPPTVKVGDCGVPERDGVVSAAPQLEHRDHDLDGDGLPEAVVVDRAMCDARDNCYWNVFVAAPDGGCARFVGALPGQSLEVRGPSVGGVPAPVRAVWQLGGDRLLMQDYEFRRGGYMLIDTLLCRRESDQQVECADDPG